VLSDVLDLPLTVLEPDEVAVCTRDTLVDKRCCGRTLVMRFKTVTQAAPPPASPLLLFDELPRMTGAESELCG